MLALSTPAPTKAPKVSFRPAWATAGGISYAGRLRGTQDAHPTPDESLDHFLDDEAAFLSLHQVRGRGRGARSIRRGRRPEGPPHRRRRVQRVLGQNC